MRGMKVFVRNTPAGPCERYVVARVVEGELWYWGSWSNMNEAYDVAKMLGGASGFIVGYVLGYERRNR